MMVSPRVWCLAMSNLAQNLDIPHFHGALSRPTGHTPRPRVPHQGRLSLWRDRYSLLWKVQTMWLLDALSLEQRKKSRGLWADVGVDRGLGIMVHDLDRGWDIESFSFTVYL